MTRQSEVSILEHVVKNPADMTTESLFVGVGEGLHYDWHIASRLMIHKHQTLIVNAVGYVITCFHHCKQQKYTITLNADGNIYDNMQQILRTKFYQN